MSTSVPRTTATTPTTTTAPAPATGTDPAATPARPGRLTVARLGAAALLAVPPLMMGAFLTSPPQTDDSNAAYIESLAADPALTGLSAALFHYAWVLLALGSLAALTLVRGRRGRALTATGAVATAVGGVQMSGLLLSDWYLASLGNHLDTPSAVAVFEGMGDPWVDTWLASGQVLGLLGPVVLLAGLARAGVVGWWTVPVMALPFVAAGMVSGLPGALLGIALYAPLVLVAVRVLRRPTTPVR